MSWTDEGPEVTVVRCDPVVRGPDVTPVWLGAIYRVPVSKNANRVSNAVRYSSWVETWHDLELGRPIAAPLERCAELLGVDLATIHEAATNAEPNLCADCIRI